MKKKTSKRSTGKALPLPTVVNARHLKRMRENAAAFLAGLVGHQGFEDVLAVFATVIPNMSVREQDQFARLLKQKIEIIEQRREGGELLAADSRVKRKLKTDARTTKLCRLYKRLRPKYPTGGRGNAETLREVSREFGPLPDKAKSITVQAIRKALKRGGLDCR